MADHAENGEAPRVYTPSTLAERWRCSERHVRNLIASGKLGHFRLGGKLLRIPADAVEKFEQEHATDNPQGPK